MGSVDGVAEGSLDKLGPGEGCADGEVEGSVEGVPEGSLDKLGPGEGGTDGGMEINAPGRHDRGEEMESSHNGNGGK